MAGLLAALFFLFLLTMWVGGMLLTLPIALDAAAWGLLAGAALEVAATVGVLAGLLGAPRVSSPAAAARLSLHDGHGFSRLDHAWPSYVFQQCWFDLSANYRLLRLAVVAVWRTAWHLVPLLPQPAAGLINATESWRGRARWPTVALAWPLLAVPAALLAGVTAGAVAALMLVAAVTAAVVTAGWVLLVAGRTVMSLWAHVARRRRRSAACCLNCYHLAERPVFVCPGEHPGAPAGAERHRRLRPSVQGLWWHRCGCGRLLPTTAARIARSLAARCPRCGTGLYPGAGYASDIRIVLFGAPRAGKSDLLAAAVRTIAGPGAVEPAPGTPSPVVSLRLAGRRRPTVVHLFHPHGADLLDAERRRHLAYLDDAAGLVYALDPFSIPGLRAEIDHLPGPAFGVDTFASADPEEAYQEVVAGLRFANVATRRKLLAVVVTKRDLLGLLRHQTVDGRSSDAIRGWIERQGMEGIAFSARHDFRRSRFFLASADERDGAGAPFRWMLRQAGAPRAPAGATVTAVEGPG
jgi:hypothetical protein